MNDALNKCKKYNLTEILEECKNLDDLTIILEK